MSTVISRKKVVVEAFVVGVILGGLLTFAITSLTGESFTGYLWAPLLSGLTSAVSSFFWSRNT